MPQTPLTEGMHAGEYIGEHAMGIGYHNDEVTVKSGSDLSAGTVVGEITASSKYVQYASGAADGSENVAGILYDNVDASAADAPGVVTKRGPMTVNGNDLVYPDGADDAAKAAVNAALLALGIKVA